MRTIRTAQMQALGQRPRDLFIVAMCTHLRTYFPAQAWLLTGAELKDRISACLSRAERYQLRSQRDACRYLSLAAQYGWQFDSDRDLSWMREHLTDCRISSPSDRLDRLVKQCIHRQAVRAANQQLRQDMGLGPQPAAAESPGTLGTPGRDSDATRPAEPPIAALLHCNRRAAQRSRALSDQVEAIEPPPSKALPWKYDTPPILRPPRQTRRLP